MWPWADVHVNNCKGCNGTFACTGCARQVGWCMGCDDRYLTLCDDCALDGPERTDQEYAESEQFEAELRAAHPAFAAE